MRVAIDFGISNTDAIETSVTGVRRWSRETRSAPDEMIVRDVLSSGGVTLDALQRIAVTGGRHTLLPARIGSCDIVRVPEVAAIGRGGQALASPGNNIPESPVLVVSAGSGTAVIAARGATYTHITGTGVGGGTLLGLGRLLLGTTDVMTIDAMAERGDPNGADLALRDVVGGPIGTLPPDATAVNFGRLARQEQPARPDDLAAALMTLVGQVIAVTAINAARAERIERVVLLGHMADLSSFRQVIAKVGEYYGMQVLVPEHAGFGTALGALLRADELMA
jgi:type II pantothenate kinase